MATEFSGRCLCGAVQFESRMAPQVAGHCHCIDCRKSSGTGHCSHIGVPEEAVTITGKTTSFDKPADSGNVITRHFCPTCGSPVFSTNTGMAGMVFLRASVLDDPEVFSPQMVVYTSRAASWDVQATDLPQHAKNPEFF